MTVYLPKGSLIELDGVALSEHNRSPASIDFEQIGVSKRTVVGTLKRQSITYKRKISMKWENLPATDAQTVDGQAGRDTINGIVGVDWVMSTTPISVTFKSDSVTPETLSCFIESYDEELVKRHDKYLWNVSLTLVEI